MSNGQSCSFLACHCTLQVVLCLGNTLWLDPLVMRAHLENIGITVNKQFVRSFLKNSGMARDNLDHVSTLRKLAIDAGLDVPPIAKGGEPLSPLHPFSWGRASEVIIIYSFLFCTTDQISCAFKD